MQSAGDTAGTGSETELPLVGQQHGKEKNMGTLNGKVALVTGAGQGLGQACARIFAREGARVIVADIQRDRGEETVKLIKDGGGEAIFSATDVSRSEDVQAVVRTAVE